MWCLILCARAVVRNPLRRVSWKQPRGRGDDGSILVRTDDATNMVIAMSEGTKVRQLSGLRSRKVDAPSLIPGLRIVAEGVFAVASPRGEDGDQRLPHSFERRGERDHR